MRTLPSWQDIAEQLSVRWCRGMLPNGQTCFEKHKGSVTVDGSTITVHWADRRVTRPAIKRFLMLVGQGQADIGGPQPAWRRQYRALRTALRFSRLLGFRFPAAYWAMDRVRLKAMLLDVPTTDPERQEAMEWLQR
jgi:hypothetical protein